MKHTYTARDVLEQLDDDARQQTGFFPDFDQGYNFHVDARLSAYADAIRWLIIIEQLCVNPRSGEFGGISTTLYYHGNCITLPEQPGWGEHPIQSIDVVSDGPCGPLFSEPISEVIRPDATDIRIRDQVIPIRTDSNYYWARKIETDSITHQQIDEWIEKSRHDLDPKYRELAIQQYESMRERVGRFELNTWHLMRGLVPEYRDLLLSTEVEQRKGVPKDLRLFARIDEWNHPRLLNGELPSHFDSFRQLARAMAAGNPKLYQPTEPGNVHWSNWPHSGCL